MTEYAPRRSSDLNQMYSPTNLAVSQYSHGSMGYLSANDHMQYAPMDSTYPTYSAAFLPSHSNNWIHQMQPKYSSMAYSMQQPRSGSLSSQPRTLPQSSYYPNSLQSPHHLQQSMNYAVPHEASFLDTEDQDSPNAATQRSEPINPPLEGYPNVDEFDRLMHHYVRNLSPKKQDKALIHAKRAANIRAVLIDKKTTQVESAQFRFWVKKMFTLQPCDPSVPPNQRKICHDNKPVAIREKLFKILTKAHKQCQHGGRDKTSAQVRRVYSWVPKELISRFVKICPTCQVRRGTNRGSPTDCDKDSGNYDDGDCSDDDSPPESRRASIATNGNTDMQSPIQISGFSTTFHHQNRWMTPLQSPGKTEDRGLKHDAGASDMGVGYHEAQTSHMKGSETMFSPGYSSMDASSAMDMTSPSYYHPGVPDYNFPQDMQYRYKHDREYKSDRHY